jgi:RNA polymerase sigma-B factor
MSADDLAEDFRRYRSTHDRRLRNSLVERNMYLVEPHVRRFQGRGISGEDLRQAGLLAMLRAIDRFDPELGVSFSTFAGRTIEGELKRHLRDRSWSVRPPRRQQELYLLARRSEEELVHTLGRSPTVAEVARAMGESEDTVVEALEAGGARRAASLDQPALRTPSPGTTLQDQIGDADARFGQVEVRLVVQRLLEALDAREREVIVLRFYEEMGQPEIAQRLGLSQSYVSRLIRRILSSMRTELERVDPEESVIEGP